MAPASSVVSARAMALGSLPKHRNVTQVADCCSAPVAGFYAAVDTPAASGISLIRMGGEKRIQLGLNSLSDQITRPLAQQIRQRVG